MLKWVLAMKKNMYVWFGMTLFGPRSRNLYTYTYLKYPSLGHSFFTTHSQDKQAVLEPAL